MLSILLIPIKNFPIPQKLLEEQQQTRREVLNHVLRRVLHALTFKHNPSAKSVSYNVLFADGNIRCCKLVSAAWLSDCPEYSNRHHLEWHVCVWCECLKNELAYYVPPDKHYPRRDHNLYRTLSDANTKTGNAQLSSRHDHQGFNVFRHIPRIVSDLPNRSTSTMQSGYPYLLTMTSHQKISHMKKFLNGLGRR
jgi:hypothetical protein